MKGAGKDPKPKRPIYRRRWPWIVLAGVAAFVTFVGPWPTYSSPYAGSGYAEATLARIDALGLAVSRGPLHAGAARAEITPPAGEPLAGYSARKPKASTGVHDRLFARAVSLSNGQGRGKRTVTIVGGDILLILPELRDAVLARAGCPHREVYFTATHTHSGPGGYSSRWVDQISLGGYDEKIVTRLADAFADVIVRSRKNMKPAMLDITRTDPPGAAAEAFVTNRIDRTSPPYDTIFTITVVTRGISPSEKIATVIVASPHPTCLGRRNRQASGDYPGLIERTGRRARDGTCMFLAGAVGSMAAAEHKPRGFARANDIARRIRRLGRAAGGRSGDFTETVTLAAAVLEVDLPAQQMRISERLRLSPIAAGYLHNRRTYIHVLRINEAVLLGMPCDYSGELAAALEAWAQPAGLMPIVTSFNGDYIGYVLPEARYRVRHYETRELNLFGPWCGEYLNELAKRLHGRLADLRQ